MTSKEMKGTFIGTIADHQYKIEVSGETSKEQIGSQDSAPTGESKGISDRQLSASTKATIDILLSTATLIEQRSGVHGDAFDNLNNIACHWEGLLNAKIERLANLNELDVQQIELTVSDVATMMILMKLSRMTFGDSNEVDHFQDIIGYAAIGTAYLKQQQEIRQANKDIDTARATIPREEACTKCGEVHEELDSEEIQAALEKAFPDVKVHHVTPEEIRAS